MRVGAISETMSIIGPSIGRNNFKVTVVFKGRVGAMSFFKAKVKSDRNFVKMRRKII